MGILDRGYRNPRCTSVFAGTVGGSYRLTRIMSGDDELFGEWVSLGGWVYREGESANVGVERTYRVHVRLRILGWVRGRRL